MEPERTEAAGWERARELFLELVEAEAPARERRLAELEPSDPELCATVRELLANDVGDEPSAADSEQVFGPYRTIERIATGGMGEVYRARRSDGEFEREVAIKRLRPGAASEELLQRFTRERRTLAQLDHPYIARLIDGGTTAGGQPYLVLEYVQGRHIDEYCRAEGLAPRARLELFRKVLDAVQYAHERGVIHRDLKPSNILVRDDGGPRLLDFGIARSSADDAAALTGTGQRLFTPQYASPEQVRGETATEASDVFALGVILYELLTDASPWGAARGLHEFEQRILAGDPPAPSRRRKGKPDKYLRGDLDVIVLRCLAVRRDERFESVGALAAELDRFLAGFPIETRATRPWVRMARAARRNPWAAAAWFALFTTAVGFGFAWRAERTADGRTRELAESLTGTLEHARGLAEDGRNPEALEELRSILSQLDKLPVEDEGLRFETLAEFAQQLLRVGEREEALAVAREGLASLPDDEGSFVRPRAIFLICTMSAHGALGNDEETAQAADRAYRYAVRWLPPGDQVRLEATSALAMGGAWLTLDERIELLTSAVAEAREHAPPRSGILGSLLLLRGAMLQQRGSLEEALACVDESLEIDRWHHGERHDDVALSRKVRGDILKQMHRLPEARTEFEAALPIFLSGEQPEMIAGSLRQLGEIKALQGEYAEALEDLDTAYGMFVDLAGSDSEVCRNLQSFIDDVEARLEREPRE